MIEAATLEGWMPFRVEWRGREPHIDWIFLGERRLSDPFFEHTMRSILHNPVAYREQLHTRFDETAVLLDELPAVPLRGLVFHMSRCGSTVVTQALTTSDEYLTISEAPPIDEVLGLSSRGVSDEQRVAWLQTLVRAMAQPRSGHEKHMVIKLDSWHIHDLPLIRQAFPDVPWVFIYRDPVEVVVSHQRLRGSQMVPGQIPPARLGLPSSVLEPPFHLDRYCAQVLAGFCNAAAQHAATHNGLLVNYSDIPDAIWSQILPHFGVLVSDTDLEQIHLRLQRHAKQPSMSFSPDSAAKQAFASEETRALVASLAFPGYQQLETMRLARLNSAT